MSEGAEGGREERRDGGTERGKEGGREGRREGRTEGTRAKPGNQLVLNMQGKVPWKRWIDNIRRT